MGEKFITIRAMFKADETDSTREQATQFFRGCGRAYDYWQDNRCGSGSQTSYWNDFRASFPQAYAFLVWRHDNELPHSSEIIGELSWAGTTHPRHRSIERQHGMIQYRTECWSGAEIHPVAVYLMAHFKARFASSHDEKYPSLLGSAETWKRFWKQHSA